MESYAIGQQILNSTEETINAISDASIKAQIQDAVGAAQQSTADQVSTLSFFYQYGWIFMIVIVTFVIFVMARETTITDNPIY